ncbi:hypothetical protein K523DRAFT_343192 [Schizophyllum commune Tattone D]|nr:hypothetical protein K523DRAFT_343192 [Schizophyllum commune Tattone D]
MLSLVLIALSASRLTSAALHQPLYSTIPVGAIKPSGWALDQAQVQADGLAGHLREFDSYVAGSIWVEGGSIEYSEMHEAAPYWFNGAVALAYQLQDERLIGEVRDFVDHLLATQQDDGWLGPEQPNSNGSPRLVWPRYLILMGLTQYVEAAPSDATRVLDAIHKFTDLVYDIWKNGTYGGPNLGFQFEYQYVRWEELVLSLQWLYDHDPRGKEDQLVETMQLLRDTGYSWKNDWFVEGKFPTQEVWTAKKALTDTRRIQTEALKSEALTWRITGDDSDKQSTVDRIDMLYKYHGRASGTYSADEHLGGLNPARGTELCTVVEQMFSLALVYSTFGDNAVADRVEKIAYNALPAGIMYDFWSPVSKSLFLAVNQIWAKEMDPKPFGANGPRSNIFGFEPTRIHATMQVNHGQGAPKYWGHAFFTDNSDNSLVHAFLGPSALNTTVGGSSIQVTVDTLYPFGNVLNYVITASTPTALKIRVPSWAQTGSSTITVGGGAATPLNPDSATSLYKVEIPAGSTNIVVILDMQVEVEERLNGAVAVTRGPLNYALELAYNVTTTEGLRCTDNHTVDNTLLPISTWALAINPDTLTVQDTSNNTDSIPHYTWKPGNLPVSMTVQACPISWDVVNGTASAPPQSPNACTGDVFEARLLPFGSSQLRLGEMPVMQA